jgi:tripartite-type tricarboxylate transporter receptor subunit TctC
LCIRCVGVHAELPQQAATCDPAVRGRRTRRRLRATARAEEGCVPRPAGRRRQPRRCRGTIGAAEVAKAPADGYTLLYTIEALALAPHLYRKLGFDPERDFAPISLLLSVPLTYLVHPSVPANSPRELAALAKQRPGQLSTGSGGTGSAAHLGLEMFKSMAGVDITHIPYKGAAPAMTDFVAGQTQVFTVSTSMAAPQVKAGKAKILVVAAPKRAANLPDVPTTAEAGFPGLEITVWMGLLAPAGARQSIVDQLHGIAVKAVNDPVNAKRYTEQGLDIVGSTPAAFRRFIAAEAAKFGRIVSAAGIKVDQ